MEPAPAVAELEDLGVEDPQHAWQVYLVTLPHPMQPSAEEGAVLLPPAAYNRAQDCAVLQAAVEETQGPRVTPLLLETLAAYACLAFGLCPVSPRQASLCLTSRCLASPWQAIPKPPRAAARQGNRIGLQRFRPSVQLARRLPSACLRFPRLAFVGKLPNHWAPFVAP